MYSSPFDLDFLKFSIDLVLTLKTGSRPPLVYTILAIRLQPIPQIMWIKPGFNIIMNKTYDQLFKASECYFY